MNTFLLIVILILAGCTLIGYIKGFVKTVFSMCAMLVVIALTLVFSPYVKTYIEKNTKLPERVNEKVAQKYATEEEINFDVGLELDEYIDKIPIPEQMKEILVTKSRKAGDSLSAGTEAAIEKMKESVRERITDTIISAIAYLFTLAVVSVVVMVAGLLLNIVSKLPVIRKLNKFLGTVAGFVEGYVVISVYYMAVTALGVTEFGSSMLQMLSESPFLTWLYANNPIINIIMKLF